MIVSTVASCMYIIVAIERRELHVVMETQQLTDTAGVAKGVDVHAVRGSGTVHREHLVVRKLMRALPHGHVEKNLGAVTRKAVYPVEPQPELAAKVAEPLYVVRPLPEEVHIAVYPTLVKRMIVIIL